MSYIKSEDKVLKRQLKQLKKSREGHVSYLTRIINNANELIMRGYSDKEQSEILLPKFKEIVHKIYVVVHCYPQKTLMKRLSFSRCKNFSLFRCKRRYKGS